MNRKGFTLVELILVMMLLATVCALVMPSLSSSFRRKNLDHEATRFYSLTEYARDEAVSQAIPMVIWIDTSTGSFGVKSKEGYPALASRNLEYSLPSEVKFEPLQNSKKAGVNEVIQFEPNGLLETHSIDFVRLTNLSASSILVAKTDNSWGYKIMTEQDYAKK
jgi:type II secretion system protein H